MRAVITSIHETSPPPGAPAPDAPAPDAPESDVRPRHLPPGFLTRRVMNPVVAWCTRRGVGLAGARILTVEGRTSGTPRATVVNPVTVGAEQYLVAPRGETQWVRNLRVARTGTLHHGRQVVSFAAIEVDDADKVPVLREYLRRWAWEVGAFFEGVSASSTDLELARIAPGFPVFRLVPTGS